jgi:hypothetical protein
MTCSNVTAVKPRITNNGGGGRGQKMALRVRASVALQVANAATISKTGT